MTSIDDKLQAVITAASNDDLAEDDSKHLVSVSHEIKAHRLWEGSLAQTAFMFGGVTKDLVTNMILRLEACKTPSPNSGWPMAAMALALGVSLQKPGVYVLNATGRPPESPDTVLAQKYGSKVVLALVLCAQVAIVLIASAGFT